MNEELKQRVKKYQRERNRIRHKELKEIAEEMGTCRDCLKRPALYKMYRCQICREKIKISGKKWRDKQKDDG